MVGIHLHGDAKMKTFEVGQRVVLISGSNLDTHEEYEDMTRGLVKSIDKEGSLTVKWDPNWRKLNPSTHVARELMAEDEANKILSKLEEEYNIWAVPVKEKIKQAANLLIEADALAALQNTNIIDMDAVNPLLSAMEDIGWSTSSLGC